MENPYELMYMAHMQDAYALHKLVEMYEPLILHVIRMYTQSDLLINEFKEDLMMEGKLGVLYGVESWRSDQEAGLSTYVKVIVQRRILNEIRYYKRERRSEDLRCLSLDYRVNDQVSLYDVESSKDGLDCPEYYLHYQEAKKSLLHEIARMNESERTILEFMRTGDSSYVEAAEMLGISIKAYDGRRQRVKEKLKKCLNKGY